MNRAECNFDLGKFQISIDDLLKALELSPTDPKILYKLGLSYYHLPNFKRCIKTLKKSIKCNPYISYEADIYYHIAIAYANLDKFERSLYPFKKVNFHSELLTQCIEMIPSDLRYIHERAKSY